MAQNRPSQPDARRRSLAQSLPWLAAMRPQHWVKNVLLFVALPFSFHLLDGGAWLRCAIGFASFCLLSSAVYIVNDLRDRRADAVHPVKRHRPIASGRLRLRAAVIESMLLLAAGLGVALGLGRFFLLVALAYVALNVLYTAWLKHHPIIDVVTLSMGFVLRAMASAVAIGVPSSAYLVLCTFMLCLFIALAKRRSEVGELEDADAARTRRVNVFYTPHRTEHMLSVSAGLAIVTYSLYCVAPATVERLGSRHLVWTIPLVVYGMFRYYCLTGQAGQDDPVRVLLRDRVLWLVALLWVAMLVLVVLIGMLPVLTPLRGVLV